MTGSNGCFTNSVSDTIEIVAVGPIADFTPDIDQGNPPLEVNFANFSTNTGFENYAWQFGDGTSSTDYDVQHIYTTGGDYEVVLAVEDQLGCTDTMIYQYVIVSNESSFLIPVVFSPNGDGINDEFMVEGYNLESLTCEIYNRWGEKVYALEGTNQGWDGRTFAGQQAPPGTYFVVLFVVGKDGVEHEPYSGSLTLVR
ncbi:MAG: gliding motility-associated C-terminal domain-containing protein [Flavobacteriales bacterium]|nr:gliding motility-associated C-terminal domain-containing protein [Flavobacteriales bacterium]